MPLYNEKIMKIDRKYNIIENIVNRIKKLDPCDYYHHFPNKDDRDKIYDDDLGYEKEEEIINSYQLNAIFLNYKQLTEIEEDVIQERRRELYIIKDYFRGDFDDHDFISLLSIYDFKDISKDNAVYDYDYDIIISNDRTFHIMDDYEKLNTALYSKSKSIYGRVSTPSNDKEIIDIRKEYFKVFYKRYKDYIEFDDIKAIMSKDEIERLKENAKSDFEIVKDEKHNNIMDNLKKGGIITVIFFFIASILSILLSIGFSNIVLFPLLIIYLISSLVVILITFG